MLRIWPCTTRTVKALWLIHVKHGNNILAYIHLLTYCIRYGFNSTPTTGSTLVGFNFFLHLLILCGNELLGFVIAMMHSTYKGIIANMDI